MHTIFSDPSLMTTSTLLAKSDSASNKKYVTESYTSNKNIIHMYFTSRDLPPLPCQFSAVGSVISFVASQSVASQWDTLVGQEWDLDRHSFVACCYYEACFE